MKFPHAVGLVCEFMPRNLEVIFAEDGDVSTLSKGTKLDIMGQCLQGLTYLHSRNVVHADIKPSNILVSEDCSTIKLCDMGLSRIKLTSTATKTKSKKKREL